MALGRHPMVDPSRQMMQPRSHVPRSAFDVRDFHKTSFGIGQLIPVYVQEILPGDSMRVHMSALVKLGTPLTPVMDNLYLQTFFFFVPNRLVWTHWEPFIAGPTESSDTTTYLLPQATVLSTDQGVGTLADYLGIRNNGTVNSLSVNALVPRGINLVWNEWFRSQQLQAKLPVPTGDGPDTWASNFGMVNVNKRHDYFTSSLPWPQAVNNTQESGNIGPNQPGGRLVFGDKRYGIGAPIHGLGVPSAAATVGPASYVESGARTVSYPEYYSSDTINFKLLAKGGSTGPDAMVLVQDMRTAVTIQNMLERQARGGGRYAEYLRVVWGVHPQDSRLQRPEFLGGGRTMITVAPVAQTSATYTAAGTDFKKTVTGQEAANAYIAATNHGYSGSFVEHGYVIGFMVVRSDLTYQQGLDRMWSRRSAFDFYRPELSGLGEQPVLSREIYSDGSGSASGAGTGDWSVFGYQERYAEYRTRLSRTSGYLNSTSGNPLDMWHFAEKFASRPTLNGTAFLPDLAPVDRTLQATAPYSAQFIADVMFENRMVRPLPMFGVPGVGERL